ncbi:unnamed protein product, partial [Mesorhabditis belari]|uniref:ANK_REP_REGION domain-containing protein n=1 Tax=Mesorhabditis belari TaxID=2138241 RepID=A0AAF3FT86_9BILA
MGIFGSKESLHTGTMGRLNENMRLYRMVDMHGGGELISWMRYAMTSGDHSIIDGYLDSKVKDFLNKNGEGILVSVAELVKIRNKQRNAMLSAFARKKGKGKLGPNLLDEFDQDAGNVGNLKKALSFFDGGSRGAYRDVCWKLEERGSMGETLLGVCLLQGTAIHNALALKLLNKYPNLINDYNISEDYYGLSPLHQAIVNEDPRMVRVLLRQGADVNKRCYGAFFCADDQKDSRTDSLEHEYVELSLKTNYTGHMYFGEYPLHFAVCMNQPECYRLLLAQKANPNAQDTNGNTVLHMCVIHENVEMLRMAVSLGASLKITNRQGLTPLTLSAKLAKKQMFIELLDMESEAVWVYGESSQTAFPLGNIDTINQETGEMNENSALALVVYGETSEHLELLDGLLENILQSKWDSYARMTWIYSLSAFTFYYLIFYMAFMNRPFSKTTEMITKGMVNGSSGKAMFTNFYTKLRINTSLHEDFYSYQYDGFDEQESQCHLSNYSRLPFVQGYFRLFCEILVLIMVIAQMVMDFLEIHRIGRHKWLNIMKAFPAKCIYKCTFIGILLLIPIRLLCHASAFFLVADNWISSILVIMTTLHFLYYSRALKFIGSFVLMIYTIIATDMSRFFLIYSIFLIGFSQSFYLIFTSCERAQSVYNNATNVTGIDEFQNVLKHPSDALVRTFIMTVGEFMQLYRQMALCKSNLMKLIGKLCFVIFEMGVSILQFNLLIAMMTRTYETIFQTRKEWKRQWALVILMLELSLSPKSRLRHLMDYSRPIGANKGLRSYVVSKKSDSGTSDTLAQVKKEKTAMMKEENKALLKRKLREADQRRCSEAWNLRVRPLPPRSLPLSMKASI